MRIKYLVVIITLAFCGQAAEKNEILYNSSETQNLEVQKRLVEEFGAIEPYCNGQDFDTLNNSNITELQIEITDSSNWYQNLYKAYFSNGENYSYINDKFKKRFNSEIHLIHDNFQCTFQAEIRISGDWKDHIDINNSISSMDVKLTTGNIFGVTKFKLLLPETRYGDNEIFVTSVLEEFGLLVPRTFYVNVNVNNFAIEKFIFQEKPAKEFIEFNQLREGPIIETNEKYYWNTSTGIPFTEEGQIFESGKITNLAWSKKSEESEFISLVALQKYNKALFTSKDNSNLNYFELNADPIKLFEFDVLLMALDASHAQPNHQRKFYYNRIENKFIPIYYDGDSQFLVREKPDQLIRETYDDVENLSFAAKRFLELYPKQKFSNKSLMEKLILKGLIMSEEALEININRLYRNINDIAQHKYVNDYLVKRNLSAEALYSKLQSTAQIRSNLIFIDRKLQIVNSCTYELIICNAIAYTNFENNIFLNENNQISNRDIIAGLDSEFGRLETQFNIDKFPSFEVRYVGDPIIELVESDLNIKFTTSEDRVLISSNSVIDNLNINISSPNTLKMQSSNRFDMNLLTGCLTLYNVEFTNLNIQSENLFCEDSVNLLNTKGSVELINIQNSEFDALDIDFSTLKINKLVIKKSKNDCLDSSNSSLNIANLELDSCFDKGFSVGEKSDINLKFINIKDSNIGIAVKDSSIVDILNYEGSNVKYCSTIFRKKQEFGPSNLRIEIDNCENDLVKFVQKGSIYSGS